MKLRGLRVIDLSSFLPGPYLTLALADHGAEVIKIEQPGVGDPMRHWAPMKDERSLWWKGIAVRPHSPASAPIMTFPNADKSIPHVQ